MTRVYLIRHAEAEGNLYRIAQGQDHSTLTNRGQIQARDLACRFKMIPLDRIYSSDLSRARETADALCKGTGSPLYLRTDLREICLGIWEKQAWGNIRRQWPEAFAYFKSDISRWSIAGAERPEDAQRRITQAIHTIVLQNEGKTLAIVSHGFVILLYLAGLQELNLSCARQIPTGGNTAVSLLEFEENQGRIIYSNDDSHLNIHNSAEWNAPKTPSAETDLWFRRYSPEDAPIIEVLSASCWNISNHSGVMHPLNIGSGKDIFFAFKKETPIGLLQLDSHHKQISQCWIRPEYKNRIFVSQLLGQAIYRFREQGVEALFISMNHNSQDLSFLQELGFVQAGCYADEILLKKDLRLKR